MSEESAQQVTQNVSISKLVKVYLKMKAKRSELASKYADEDGAIKTQMDMVKHALLNHCKETGADSVRTEEGLFYRTTRQSYWTNDWDAMGKFIIEHKVPELLEKRIQQTNMKQFLEDNPELLPPGLNVDSEYTITVRRK